MYFYYYCHRGASSGQHNCTSSKCIRAKQIERTVWNFTYELLTKPEQLQADLEQMIELEREAKAWLNKLAETDRDRRGYQRLAANGHMTDEELDEALAGAGGDSHNSGARIGGPCGPAGTSRTARAGEGCAAGKLRRPCA
jgi:DNA-binding phage protein